VICCARPSLYERRPTWGSGQRFHARIDLKPLDKRDSRDLALAILQKVADVPKDLRDLLVERAEGNPLYMEELVKMLLDDRVLIKNSDDRWHAQVERLGALSVPATLSGLLETRFDTLLYPEKLTLQRASVIGRIFYNTALQAIDNNDDTHIWDVPDVLTKLVERSFIYKRETSSFSGSVEYIFASAMLRDTLYDRLLERQRRIYHAGAAAWLASLENAEEYLPLIAEHYEKSGDLIQAAVFLQRAGEIATRRGTYSDAAAFYQRALALQPAISAPSARLPLLLALGEAVNQQGDVAMARTVLGEALSISRSGSNSETLANTLYQLSLTETTYGDYPAALTCLNEALALARMEDNPQILANVLYGLANTHYRIGNQAEGIAAAEECIDLCNSTGNDVLRMYVLNRLGTLIYILDGAKADTPPTYYEKALALARLIGHRQGELIILSNLGYHAADLADWTLAIRYTEQALQLARELRYLTGITVAAINLADYWINANQTEKVPPLLREALLTARQMASPSWLVSTVGSAGWLKLAQKNAAGGLRLIGLLAVHPASSADAKVEINRHVAYARETLGLSEAEIEAGMATGKELDLDVVVDELLHEFKD
jgi:tetratricopeptide (TPR) repeat protein